MAPHPVRRLGTLVEPLLTTDGVDGRTEGVGKLIGAPWRKDHRLAASAALRALRDRRC